MTQIISLLSMTMNPVNSDLLKDQPDTLVMTPEDPWKDFIGLGQLFDVPGMDDNVTASVRPTRTNHGLERVMLKLQFLPIILSSSIHLMGKNLLGIEVILTLMVTIVKSSFRIWRKEILSISDYFRK